MDPTPEARMEAAEALFALPTSPIRPRRPPPATATADGGSAPLGSPFSLYASAVQRMPTPPRSASGRHSLHASPVPTMAPTTRTQSNYMQKLDFSAASRAPTALNETIAHASSPGRFNILIQAGKLQPFPAASTGSSTTSSTGGNGASGAGTSKRRARARDADDPYNDDDDYRPAGHVKKHKKRHGGKGGKLIDGATESGLRDPHMAACNCRKSHCLKLYCECFAAKVECRDCNCENCHNTSRPEHAAARATAVKQVLFRNPNAFQPKIKSDAATKSGHSKGCHCKKSNCLKKYCECYQAGVLCTKSCKCLSCKNFEGSVELADKRSGVFASGSKTSASKRSRAAY